MLVEEMMSRKVRTVHPDLSVGEAAAFAHEHRIRHLPVVEGEGLVGLVTDRDLRSALPSSLAPDESEELRSRPVSTIMVRNVITAHPLDFVEDAARVIYEHRIGCLPVLQGERLVGILTERDILHRLVEIYGVHQPSQPIVIRVEDRIGVLADVSRIFSNHRTNILSVRLERTHPEGFLHLIFRVQAKDLREEMGDLSRAGYEVVWPIKEPHK